MRWSKDCGTDSRSLVLCHYFARRKKRINSNPSTSDRTNPANSPGKIQPLSLRLGRQSERKYWRGCSPTKVGLGRVLDAKRNRIQGHERGDEHFGGSIVFQSKCL